MQRRENNTKIVCDSTLKWKKIYYWNGKNKKFKIDTSSLVVYCTWNLLIVFSQPSIWKGSTTFWANTVKVAAENIFTTFYSLIWSVSSNFVQTHHWLLCCWRGYQHRWACPSPPYLSHLLPRTYSRRLLLGSLRCSVYPWSSAACPCAFQVFQKSCCFRCWLRFFDLVSEILWTAIAGRTI